MKAVLDLNTVNAENIALKTYVHDMGTLCLLGESSRMHLAEKMLQKHKNAEQERKSRVMNGIKKRIEELQAYQNVLHSYR